VPEPGTTDDWPLGRLVKYTLLPRPKDAPRPGRRERWVRASISLVCLAIAVAILLGYL